MEKGHFKYRKESEPKTERHDRYHSVQKTVSTLQKILGDLILFPKYQSSTEIITYSDSYLPIGHAYVYVCVCAGKKVMCFPVILQLEQKYTGECEGKISIVDFFFHHHNSLTGRFL